jgi:hypothetical protein
MRLALEEAAEVIEAEKLLQAGDCLTDTATIGIKIGSQICGTIRIARPTWIGKRVGHQIPRVNGVRRRLSEATTKSRRTSKMNGRSRRALAAKRNHTNRRILIGQVTLEGILRALTATAKRVTLKLARVNGAKYQNPNYRCIRS